MQEWLDLWLLGRSLHQQFRQADPQGEPWAAAEGEKRVERRPRGRLCGTRRLAGKQAAGQRRPEIENPVADRNAALRFAGGAEDPERQVLDRKVRMAVRRGDEAPARRVMGLIDLSHRALLCTRRRGERKRPSDPADGGASDCGTTLQ